MNKAVLVFLIATVASSNLVAAMSRIPTPSPRDVACGDANGDGAADLIVANGESRKVSIFLGDGSGGFKSQTSIPIEGIASAVHFNPAAKHILVTNETKSLLTVFSPDRTRGGYTPWHAAIGRGARDITIRASVLPKIKDAMVIATGGAGMKTISVFEACYGCVCTHHDIESGLEPSAVVAVDIDNDGSEEIAVANRGSNDVTIIRRDPVIGFAPVTSIDATPSPVAIAALDFDGDGNRDLVVGGETLVILLSDGAFGSKGTLEQKGFRNVRDLRVDREDGKDQLVVTDERGLFVYRNGAPLHVTAQASGEMCSADFNGDGIFDHAVAGEGEVRIHLMQR